MKIDIRAKESDLTPAITTYIEEKFSSLDKLLQNFEQKEIIELFVEVGRETGHHHKGNVFFAEVNLPLRKKLLRARESAESVRAAVDLVKNKISREIKKFKELSESNYL